MAGETGAAKRAAEPEPVLKEPHLAGKNAKEHLLMISGQEDRLHATVVKCSQPLDYAPRVRPPIDQVAKEYDQIFAGRPLGEIRVNGLEQLIQQIQPSMDVSYGIGAIAAGCRRLIPCGVAPRKHRST